jgi:hypothetical protein
VSQYALLSKLRVKTHGQKWQNPQRQTELSLSRLWQTGGGASPAPQFVQDPQNKPIDQATKNLIDKLLLERLSLAGIARGTGVSELWLQRYVNAKYAAVPRSVSVSAKKRDD